MHFQMFHDLLPEVAERENRTLHVIAEGMPVPPGDYLLAEMFCLRPGCDCRRVFLAVITMEARKPLAYIAFGWEDRAFYEGWMRTTNRRIIDGLIGPNLNFGSPRSRLAPALLQLVVETALQDPKYIRRIARHYRLFKAELARRPKAPSPRPRGWLRRLRRRLL